MPKAREKPAPGEIWIFGPEAEVGLVLAVRGTSQSIDAVTVLSRASVWKNVVSELWAHAFFRRVPQKGRHAR